MKKIISVIGARPQFIKHAPMQLALQKYFDAKTIHTGQHYDENMSTVFFNELGIPKPDFLFNMEGVSRQGAQTGLMMRDIEEVCTNEKPDAILVYGDTNSTLAGTLVAAKMHIPLIHVEAGLRSFNRQMPEEINRIVADEFASMLFCPISSSIENLKKEGITHDKIFLCGDVMKDILKLIEPNAKKLVDEAYYFSTIHRPYNTDNEERLLQLLTELNSLDKKVYLALHPRTANRLSQNGVEFNQFSNIVFLNPVSYKDSISYQKFADCVITDSGGIQKEAYILKTKCITLRSETEWTETLENGWNSLVFDDLSGIKNKLNQQPGAYNENLYGDGKAAEEIVEIINKNL